MKTLAFLLAFFGILSFTSKVERIESKVYSYSNTKVVKNQRGEKRQLMDGETTHMQNFEIHTTTLNPGATPHGKYTHTEFEEFLLVKEGSLKVTLNNESKIVGPGSVALILPGDEFDLENGWDKPTTYFVVKYKSKAPIDPERGKMAGGSLLLNWEELKFQPHDRGGQRKFFDRKSAMSERIEMHATTLNPAIKSHEPHTHAPAEIVIMMAGTTEMEIGDNIYPGKVGDVYFLGSNIPHAIRNTGTEPCTYLAFQWE
jgi:(S)-ureidoglycine aminohydrolase